MQRFYFDYNATTPVSPEVLQAVVPAMTEVFGNASSIHHHGQAARALLDEARRHVAALLGAEPGQIVFTSGGTEADNLALFGVLRGAADGRKHVVTTTIEHPAVLNSCAQLQREGCEITYVAVGPSGVVDPAHVRRALRADTAIVSVMHANNETGTVQPLAEIAAAAHEAGALMHSDGVQAAGKLEIDVQRLGLDLYSISGHKFHAPKGVGALYVRDGVRLAPMIFGGHHERDRRAGTENVAGAAALGRAAQWLQANPGEMARLSELRDRLERAVLGRIDGARVNCAGSRRVPNTSNMRFDGIDSEPLLIALDLKGYAVSSGSACSSGAAEPSHVLTAIGLTRDQARACLRVSLGRWSTRAQVDDFVEALTESVAKLRRLSVHA